MTLTWRTAFLSITRYAINKGTHKGAPYSNKTLIKWFLAAIITVVSFFTALSMYHVFKPSIQIQNFCKNFNCQENEDIETYDNSSICLVESPKPPDMFSLEWSLTLAQFVAMLLGAALGYYADWKLKVFVEKQKMECENLGIQTLNLDDTIPVKATRISMSSIVLSFLLFPLRFVEHGTWLVSLALCTNLSLQVPILALLTFKHQQEQLKFLARENPRFAQEFPLNEVKIRRPSKIVKRVQWKVGHWGQNGTYYEPSSPGPGKKYWDKGEELKKHFNTILTPDFDSQNINEIPLNVYQIVSYEESQDLSEHKTPEVSVNVSQDLSDLSQDIQQYVADYLSRQVSQDVSNCMSQEISQNISDSMSQEMSRNLSQEANDLSLINVSQDHGRPHQTLSQHISVSQRVQEYLSHNPMHQHVNDLSYEVSIHNTECESSQLSQSKDS